MNAPYTLPHGDSNAISHNLCHGCGLCAMQCPTKALVMERHELSGAQCHHSPVIRPQMCVHCGRCAAVCPAGTIFEYHTEQILHKVQAENITQIIFLCDALNTPPASPPYIQPVYGQATLPQEISLIDVHRLTRLQDAVHLPPSSHLEVVRCTGRIGARYLLRLALLGVENSIIFACPPAQCHYSQGRPAVAEQVQALTSLVEDYGASMQIQVIQQPLASAAELQDLIRKHGGRAC